MEPLWNTKKCGTTTHFTSAVFCSSAKKSREPRFVPSEHFQPNSTEAFLPSRSPLFVLLRLCCFCPFDTTYAVRPTPLTPRAHSIEPVTACSRLTGLSTHHHLLLRPNRTETRCSLSACVADYENMLGSREPTNYRQTLFL